MKNLKSLYAQAIDMVGKAHINHGEIITIQPHQMNAWGKCRRYPDGKFYITINPMLLEDSVSDRVVLETIIHEIIHTVQGCFNHSPVWKKYVQIINDMYNMDISRTKTFEYMGIEKPKETARYILKCEQCGHEYTRQRMSDVIRYPELYRCKHCDGKLKRIK